jgi:hypothetical protein
MYNNSTKKRWLNSSIREEGRNSNNDKLKLNSTLISSSSLVKKYIDTSSSGMKGILLKDEMENEESKNKEKLGNTRKLNSNNYFPIKWTEDKIDNCKRCLEHFLNNNEKCKKLKEKYHIEDNLSVSDYITTKDSIKFYVKNNFTEAPSIEELFYISLELSKEIPGFYYSNEMQKFTTHSIYKSTKIKEEEKEEEEGKKRRRPSTILLPTQEYPLIFVYKPHKISDPKFSVLLAILCFIILCVFSLRFYYIYSEQGYTLINAMKEMFYYHCSNINIIESTDL